MDPAVTTAPAAEWVSIFRSSSRGPCDEQALVLRAMGLEHRVTEQPDGCHVLVPPALARAAVEQLGLYRRENPGRPRLPWPQHPASRGLPLALGYSAVLALAFSVQVRYALGIDWLAAGGLGAGEVRDGALWLTVTALMLHADFSHVLGNMLFGSFFGYLAGQYLGSGVAALAILLTGAAGNLVNAWLQDAAHRSIGASTSVFAALGLVGACVWSISRHHELGWARRWSPAVGAVALLSYVGTGDAQTDIVAHLTGFLAGAGGGYLLYRARGTGQPHPAVQATAAALGLGIVLLCWALAVP